MKIKKKKCLSGIMKINDTMYTGKVAGYNLWCVMELVTDNNVGRWKQYASVQSAPEVIEMSNRVDSSGIKSLQPGSTSEGAVAFRDVLNWVSHNKNELWVAYLTNNQDIEPIPDIMDYSPDTISHNRFAQKIRMYMTVTSSPDALFTSHMGICRSIEALYSGAERGVSIDLHSFAAKVMLLRNPKRRYMINVPAFAMEAILLKELQAAIFVGTKEMADKIEQCARLTFDLWEASILPEDEMKYKYMMRGLAQITGMSEDVIKQQIDMIKQQDFLHARNPFAFPYLQIDKKQWNATDDYVALFKTNPPRISVPDNFQFIVFDDDGDQWLIISKEKDDPTYNWMSQYFWKEIYTSSHYITVNLQALGEARRLE